MPSACCRVLLTFACVLALSGVESALRAETLAWTKQIGTTGRDQMPGVSADGLGNVYVSGRTTGAIGGGTNTGGEDVFVAKYDAAGTHAWTKMLGSTANDRSVGVSADGLGNVFITGWTEGNVGGANVGSVDSYVTKYNAVGTLLWSKHMGTSSGDGTNGISADGVGNVYVTGSTGGSLFGTHAGGGDAFLAKYGTTGDLLWSRQFGASGSDTALAVAADGVGNVYVSGSTTSNLEGSPAAGTDAFVAKYDGNGNREWIRQFGTSGTDAALAVSADGLGRVFVAGRTSSALGGSFMGGSDDAFITMFDASGTRSWSRQLGTSASDIAHGLSADGLGGVHMTGRTTGGFGKANAGASDAFIVSYNVAGNVTSVRQMGTSAADDGFGISADGLGNVYAAGDAAGSLGGTLVGMTDGYLVKLGAGPPGDFSGDGAVDGGDILTWQRGLGRYLNSDDLASWRAGIVVNSGGNLVATPEPAGAAQMIMALVGLFASRQSTPRR
jgi:hypothetical protein